MSLALKQFLMRMTSKLISMIKAAARNPTTVAPTATMAQKSRVHIMANHSSRVRTREFIIRSSKLLFRNVPPIKITGIHYRILRLPDNTVRNDRNGIVVCQAVGALAGSNQSAMNLSVFDRFMERAMQKLTYCYPPE